MQPFRLPIAIQEKLQQQSANKAYRQLSAMPANAIDFCSNDYLGIIQQQLISVPTSLPHGSGGSRLIAGHSTFNDVVEQNIAQFHQHEAALLFNSGYDANLSLLGAVPQKGDTILYDFLSHTSIRDGIKLSQAQSAPFLHNDLIDLERRLQQLEGTVYVVTESVFSMDGDQAPLAAMVSLCEKYGAFLIVDEAHGIGVIGERGEGLVQKLGLTQSVFAIVYTYGKAPGCHGACVVGAQLLKEYLINFARPFIYSTGISPQTVSAIAASYQLFPNMHAERQQIRNLIQQFQLANLPFEKLRSNTPIQGVIIPGNEAVVAMAQLLESANIYCKAVRYPTVPKGKERLRIILHAFNTAEEVDKLIHTLQQAL